jgi:hypothetical protein
MHNIYRKLENGDWETFTKVVFPDGQIMDDDNNDFQKDGFFWSESAPQEYLEWLEKQDKIDGNS